MLINSTEKNITDGEIIPVHKYYGPYFSVSDRLISASQGWTGLFSLRWYNTTFILDDVNSNNLIPFILNKF